MVSVCLPSDALLQHLLSYLGFSWTWGISSQLLQQSTATAPYLGRGVSPHRRPSWPWTWNSVICKSDHINPLPPVFLPGEFHGQRSLADYSHTESNATERLTLSLSLSSDGSPYHDTVCSHLYKLSILISYGPQSPGSHWLLDAPHTHTCVSTWPLHILHPSPPSLYSNVTFCVRTSPATLSLSALFFSVVLLTTYIILIIYLVSHLLPHTTTTLTHRDSQNT